MDERPFCPDRIAVRTRVRDMSARPLRFLVQWWLGRCAGDQVPAEIMIDFMRKSLPKQSAAERMARALRTQMQPTQKWRSNLLFVSEVKNSQFLTGQRRATLNLGVTIDFLMRHKKCPPRHSRGPGP
jgi:hypothetical protein